MGELCLFASHHLERNQNVGWRAVVERGTMVNVRFSRVTSVRRDDNCVPKYRTLRAWSPTGCSFPVGVMCNRLKCLEPEMVLYSDCKAGEGERQGRDKIKGGGKENEKREPYLLSSGNNTSISNGDDCNRQTFLCCRSRGGVKKVESVWRQENLSLSSLSIID